MPLETVIEILRKEAGSHFAPEVVDAFMHCLPDCLMLYRGEHFSPEYVDGTLGRLAPESLPKTAAGPL
jgi:hypothetical protein